MNAVGNKTRWLRIVMAAVLVIALVWLVLTKSLVAYLAKTSPGAALALRPDDAVTLVQLASDEMKLRQQRKVEQMADGSAAKEVSSLATIPDRQVRQWALIALRQEPLAARSLRILGQLSEKAGDSKTRQETRKLMSAAARLSKRQSVAVYWLIKDRFAREDYAKAVSYIDILLRSDPLLTEHTVQILVRIAQTEEGQARVAEALASNPPWRWRFFKELRKTSMVDARMPLRLLLDLQKTSAPPTAKELRFYLRFLLKENLYQLAYYSWLQFLPRKQLESAGPLFDGGFNYEPRGLPFGWRLPIKSQAQVKITDRPDQTDNRALSVEFGYGHEKFTKVQQMTMLNPGRYLFKGSYRGTLKGRRGLLWRVVCVGGNRAVKKMNGPMFVGREQKWKTFEFAFEIPEQDCPAQSVQLIHDARTKSERLASGQVWYDDLKISRAR